MNRLVRFIEKEVALDAPLGTSLNRLWYIVQCFLKDFNVDPITYYQFQGDSNSLTLTSCLDFHGLDLEYCQFIWKLLLNESSLLFGKCESPCCSDTLQGQEKHSTISIPTKGSKESISKKKKMNSATTKKSLVEPLGSEFNIHYIDPTTLLNQSINALYETYGNFLLLFMPENARLDLLVPPLARPLPPASWTLLQTISQTRDKGITQSELASQTETDPRTIFHIVKVLCLKHLIIKLPFIINGSFSPLLLNPMFASLNKDYTKMMTQSMSSSSSSLPLEKAPLPLTVNSSSTLASLDDVSLGSDEEKETFVASTRTRQFNMLFYLRRKISNLLSLAPQSSLSSTDLCKQLSIDPQRHHDLYICFKRTLNYLYEKKYLEKSIQGNETCFTLLKPFHRSGLVGSVSLEDTPTSIPHLSSSMSTPSFVDLPQGVLNVDLPLELQIYLTIASSPSGLTVLELKKKMNNISSKPLNKILDRFIQPRSHLSPHPCLLLKRVMELKGKLRQYRYFTESIVATVHRDNKHLQACLQYQSQKLTLQAPSSLPPPPPPASTSTLDSSKDSPSLPPLTLSTPSSSSCTATSTPTSSLSTPVSTTTEPTLQTLSKRATIEELRRREVILHLIQRHRVLELKLSTLKLIEAELTNRFPTSFSSTTPSSNLDRKTVLRAVRHLEIDGFVQIQWFVLPLLSGKHEKRQVIVLVDPEKPIDKKEVLEALSTEENVFYTSDIFESLDPLDEVDNKSTLFNSEPPLLSPSSASSSSSSNLSTLKLESASSITWKSVARAYGWVLGRMQRLKLFHFFLYDLTQDRAPLYEFEVNEVFRKLPLRFYLQIIGVAPKTDHFMETFANQLILPLTDLKEPIKSQLLLKDTERRRFKHQIYSLLKGLIALGLVSVPEEPDLYRQMDETSVLAKQYQVTRSTFFMNYSFPQRDRVPLHTVSIALFAEVEQFWNTLSSLASQFKSKFNPSPTDPLRFFLRSLHWYTHAFTMKQKETLEAHCDFQTGYTPSLCTSTCQWVAKETGLTLMNVKHFFFNFEFRFQRNPQAFHTVETKSLDSFLQAVFGSCIPRRKKGSGKRKRRTNEATTSSRLTQRKKKKKLGSSSSMKKKDALDFSDSEESLKDSDILTDDMDLDEEDENPSLQEIHTQDEFDSFQEENEHNEHENSFYTLHEPLNPILPQTPSKPSLSTPFSPSPSASLGVLSLSSSPISHTSISKPFDVSMPSNPSFSSYSLSSSSNPKKNSLRASFVWTPDLDLKCLQIHIITSYFKSKQKASIGVMVLPNLEIDGKPLWILERRARYIRRRPDFLTSYSSWRSLWEQHQVCCHCSPEQSLDLCLQHFQDLLRQVQPTCTSSDYFPNLPDSLSSLHDQFEVMGTPEPGLDCLQNSNLSSSSKMDFLMNYSFYDCDSSSSSLPSFRPSFVSPIEFDSFPFVTSKQPNEVPVSDQNNPSFVHQDSYLVPLSKSVKPQEIEEKERMLCCMQLIKMICLAPEQIYPSHQAFRLLQQFPSSTIESALIALKDTGILVRNRKEHDRQFQISEHHLSLLYANAGHRRTMMALKKAPLFFSKPQFEWHFHEWVEPYDMFLFLEGLVSGLLRTQLRIDFTQLFSLSIVSSPLHLFSHFPLLITFATFPLVPTLPPLSSLEHRISSMLSFPSPLPLFPPSSLSFLSTYTSVDQALPYYPQPLSFGQRFRLSKPDGSGEFNPRLWYSIQGTSVPALLKTCLVSLWSIIYKAPGISMDKLLKAYEGLFFLSDLVELLDMLLYIGAIVQDIVEEKTSYYAEPCTLIFLQ